MCRWISHLQASLLAQTVSRHQRFVRYSSARWRSTGSYLTIRNYLNAIIVLLLNREAFSTALERYQEREMN